MNDSFNPFTLAHLTLVSIVRNSIEGQSYIVIKALFVSFHSDRSKLSVVSSVRPIEMCRLTANSRF
jgi:nicotinic acid mononucleotide adenylyltransferase